VTGFHGVRWACATSIPCVDANHAGASEGRQLTKRAPLDREYERFTFKTAQPRQSRRVGRRVTLLREVLSASIGLFANLSAAPQSTRRVEKFALKFVWLLKQNSKSQPFG
jgi:hypothetical protein